VFTAAALVVLAFAMLSRARGAAVYGAKPKKTGKMKRSRAELQGRATALAVALDWPQLDELVDATAATESGWNLRPYGRAPTPGSNKAVGPMQLRPKSAGDSPRMRELFLADPTYLEDSGVAVAAATAFWARLSDNNPDATLGMLRASFAYPIFIHGRPKSVPEVLKHRAKLDLDGDGTVELWEWQTRYDDAIRRFKKALRQTRMPESLANKRAFPRIIRTNVIELLPLVMSARGADLVTEMAK
jgi:hypothetical protein